MKIQERKERDRLRKQRDFFAAAEKLFALKGYDNTSVSDIAREAGYAAGTLYLYFANKDELLVGCLEYNMTMFHDGIEKALGGIEHPEERLKIYLFGEVRGLIKHAKAFAVIFPILLQPKWWEQHDEEGRLKEIIQNKDNTLRKIVSDLKTQGAVDSSIDVEFFILAIGGMVREMVLCHSIKKKLFMEPEDIARNVYEYACKLLGLKGLS